MAEPPVAFAALLRNLRAQAGLGQELLAHTSGVRMRTISALRRACGSFGAHPAQHEQQAAFGCLPAKPILSIRVKTQYEPVCNLARDILQLDGLRLIDSFT